MLQNPDQEYFLITNEKNDYELLPYEQITNIADHSREVRAFIFKRGADWYVMYWHISDNKNLELPLKADNVTLYKDFKTKVAITSSSSGNIVLPANDRKYLRFKNLTKDQIIKAFQNAKILD